MVSPFLSSAEPFPILPRLPLRHRPEFPSIWDLLALHCFVPGFLPLPALPSFHSYPVSNGSLAIRKRRHFAGTGSSVYW